MIHGLDTGFLVAAEVLEHTEHVAARVTLARLLAAGDHTLARGGTVPPPHLAAEAVTNKPRSA
jgi:hypothetical protein